MRKWRIRLKKILFFALVVFTLTFIISCGVKEVDTSSSLGAGIKRNAAAETAQKSSELVRVAFLREEMQGMKANGNQQFVEEMSMALGLPTELYVVENYTEAMEAMRTKQVDIASFSPLAYILASERGGAIAFAVKATSEEMKLYTNLVVVPAQSKVQSLTDLKGKSLLSTDSTGNSANIMGRAHLVSQLKVSNYELDSFINFTSSNGHEKSILTVAKGKIDGAIVCEPCIKKVIAAGLVKETDFRVISKSDPIPANPYAYRKTLPIELVEKLKAFVLSYKTEQNPNFFNYGKEAFFPMEDNDYQTVRDTAKALHMTSKQLLLN